MPDPASRRLPAPPASVLARPRRAGGGRRPPSTQPRAEGQRLGASQPDGPTVVALGGGHGLAAALQAVRRYAGSITAVVSLADDGGSSGRLRRALGTAPPGDLRKCLVALGARDSIWRDAFEHRFSQGELEGHALGNIVLAGLTAVLGDLGRALEEAGRLLRAQGRVVPATSEAVVLAADVDGKPVEGQVAVATSPGRIRRVQLVPVDAKAHPEAVSAIELADQVVLGPGSLFTSVIPVVAVAGIRDALLATRARVVQVCNLRSEVPETVGLDGTDHLRAVLEHGARVDVFLYQEGGSLAADHGATGSLGVEAVAADVARADGLVHDPVRLARALATLV